MLCPLWASHWSRSFSQQQTSSSSRNGAEIQEWSQGGGGIAAMPVEVFGYSCAKDVSITFSTRSRRRTWAKEWGTECDGRGLHPPLWRWMRRIWRSEAGLVSFLPIDMTTIIYTYNSHARGGHCLVLLKGMTRKGAFDSTADCPGKKPLMWPRYTQRKRPTYTASPRSWKNNGTGFCEIRRIWKRHKNGVQMCTFFFGKYKHHQAFNIVFFVGLPTEISFVFLLHSVPLFRMHSNEV